MKKVTQITAILFFMLSSSVLFAENPDFLKVNGQVTSGEKIMKNAVITIISKDKSIQIVSTDDEGYFNVSLNYGKEYTLNVIKNGHSPKTIVFSTKAPNQFKSKSFKFYCMVHLDKIKRKTKEIKNKDTNTVGYVFFNHKDEFFTHKSKIYDKQHYNYFYE